MFWRKIRDTSEMNKTSAYRTGNLHAIHEIAAWPDFWVLRGASNTTGHILYGLDIQANRLVWSLGGLNCPEGLGWTWNYIPFLAHASDLVVVATYVGRNRERVWLLALEPRSGNLVWRKPVAWLRRSGKSIYDLQFIGIISTGEHLVAMENRGEQGVEPYLLWLDPATGETVHECLAVRSKDPAAIAGGYIYLSNGTANKDLCGLYRVPVTPGAGAVERLLSTRVTSLLARGDSVYAVHAGEDLCDWTFTRWDARTFEEQCVQQISWEKSRSWPRLREVDPEQPDHIILQKDTRLWCMDLRTGAMSWEHEFEDSLNVERVLRSHHGMLLNSNVGVEVLDPRTGDRGDLGITDVIDVTIAVGDYIFTSQTFGSGSSLYVAEGSPSAMLHPEPVTGDETWTKFKLRALLPDLLVDPRDELETAFGKAAGRGSLNTLFKKVRQVTKTSQTHQKVKAYLKALKAGELDDGPLNFTPLAKLHMGCFFYPDLFSFGPDEHFFPGMLMAGEYGGVEFYLMLETGKVISLHHDASFYEVASDVWQEVEQRVKAFEREFPAQGGVLDIAQLMRFQQTFAGVKSTGDLMELDTRDFLARTAKAFGWSLEELRQQLDRNYLPLEFLHIHEEELEILDTMLTEKSE